MRLQESEQICLTEHLVTVHVEHHECEPLHESDMLHFISIFWLNEYSFKLFIENVIVNHSIRPIEDSCKFLG